MADNLNRIEELKAEGNSLIHSDRPQDAYDKYTEAIKIAPRNAVLYFNRAAASLRLKQYLDAASDSQMAINLDPTYCKAWARLGKASHALSAWEGCIGAYEKALETMPSSGLDPATAKTLKKQCQEGLKTARQMLTRPLDDAQFTGCTAETDPLARAQALQLEFRQAGIEKSSVWTLLHAYDEFQKGAEVMVNNQSNAHDITKPAAMTFLCNAVMCDPRAYAAPNKAWEYIYNRQVLFEIRAYGAWSDIGAKKVLEDAPKRLEASGWNNLRPALDVTVRMWIVTAFQNGMIRNLDTAVQFYRGALDLVQAGQKMWKGVSREDRGTIFDTTFVRSVKRKYMLAVADAFHSGGKVNSSYKFEEVLQLANEIIEEVKANPPQPNNSYDHAFICSQWGNTIGDAYSMLAFHHMETGKASPTKAQNARKHFTDAAKYYLLAAEAYPKDDERHITFLAMTVQAYWHRGIALRLTHPLSKRLCEDRALAQRVWATEVATDTITQVVEFKQECDKAIAKGKMTLDDVVQPEWANSLEDKPGAFSLYKGIYGWKWKVYKKA